MIEGLETCAEFLKATPSKFERAMMFTHFRAFFGNFRMNLEVNLRRVSLLTRCVNQTFKPSNSDMDEQGTCRVILILSTFNFVNIQCTLTIIKKT